MIEQPPACARHGHATLRGLGRNFARDLERYLRMTPEMAALPISRKRQLSAALRPDLLALLGHRIAHYCHAKGWRRLGHGIALLNHVLHKVNLPADSCIGPGCRIPHPVGVVFRGSAGENLTVYSLAVCCPGDGDYAVLGDNVTLGAHAVVVGRVSIGDEVRLAFGVRIERDVPARVVAISRVIRSTDQPVARRDDTARDTVHPQA